MNEERILGIKNKINYYRVQANVDLKAICHNIREVKSLLKNGTKLMMIIKADAYGHGAVPVARAIDGQGIDAYGVAIIEEAIELREAGITKPILILGYTPKEQYELVVAYDVSQTVFQYEMAEALSEEAKRQGKKAKIHIKLDTGMSRIGFSDTKESLEEIKVISQLDGIEMEGIFSHFACADEMEKTNAENQWKRYHDFVQLTEKENIHFPIKHISNSAGIIDIPKANLDMVRCGIISYGIYPSNEVLKNRIKLIPALEIKTHVIYVKEVEAGVGISYGATYVTKRKTKVATIPVGYADGYSRNLSNTGKVIIHGQYAPIIGRICMDQFMVDVTDIDDVRQGDTVTLLGRDQDAYISVEELAKWSHSFPYELVCTVGKRIPRCYLN
ncbi:MAG TPA: alanine racemase [Clostridiales bacterium]|jgi:alanine racemase|nr:alanine racemase [Clostridiales bacterium]